MKANWQQSGNLFVARESSTRMSLASQFNELRSQVDGIAADSSYNGVNLLKNNTGKFAPGADYPDREVQRAH